jgi:hypothetical protein
MSKVQFYTTRGTVAMAGDIYEVTAEGQYYALTGNKKDIKPYTITFLADETVKKSGFLSAFRNALAPRDGVHTNLLRMMMEKYPDYKRFRTHQIVDGINISQKNKPVKELGIMNRTQIVNFINHKGLPIDTELYPAVTDLRQALKDYRENPEAFKKQQDKRRATKGPELAVSRSLDTLNDPSKPYNPKKPIRTLPEAPVVDSGDDIPVDNFTDDIIPDDVSIPTYDDEDQLDELIAGI